MLAAPPQPPLPPPPLLMLLEQVVNLDRGLTPAQRSEALAFASLVEAKLQPALLYMTWCGRPAGGRLGLECTRGSAGKRAAG